MKSNKEFLWSVREKNLLENGAKSITLFVDDARDRQESETEAQITPSNPLCLINTDAKAKKYKKAIQRSEICCSSRREQPSSDFESLGSPKFENIQKMNSLSNTFRLCPSLLPEKEISPEAEKPLQKLKELRCTMSELELQLQDAASTARADDIFRAAEFLEETNERRKEVLAHITKSGAGGSTSKAE